MKVFFVENQGLYADEELITDFEPKVIGIQQHISLSDGMEKRMYQVMVRKSDGSETAVKEVSAKEDAVKIISEAIERYNEKFSKR